MRLRRSAFTKVIVMAIVCVMCISTFSFAVFAETTETTGTPGTTVEENSGKTTADTNNAENKKTVNNDDEMTIAEMHKNSFSNYLLEIADKPDATEKVTTNFSTAELKKGGEITSYIGKDNILKLSEGDIAGVKINVPSNGVYYFNLEYCPIVFKARDIELKMKIDGKIPYSDAQNITLKRNWKDKTEIQRDLKDNDITPKQEEVFSWATRPLKDYVNYVNEEYRVYLEAGEHQFDFEVVREAIAISTLTLSPKQNIPSYQEVKAGYDKNGYKPATSSLPTRQAEKSTFKTDSVLVPTYDRSSPATEPYHVSKIRRNTIGQEPWSDLGMAITYEFDVAESGLYDLGMKYRQCYLMGVSTSRNIYIDGVIPFKEYENVKFKYADSWQFGEVRDANGNECLIYLEGGKTHTVTFETTLGVWNETLQKVDKVNRKLSDLYKKIVMITGASPDTFRDYYLDKHIPNLISDLTESSKILKEQADEYDRLNNERSAKSSLLRMSAQKIDIMVKKPDEIKHRLSDFRASISGISTWLQECKMQPLELDYFLFSKPGEENPKVSAGFFADVSHFVGSFFASFFEDYDNFSDNAENKQAIRVWVGDGRDQVQILKDLINDSFTATYEIPVDLSLIQAGLMEATLAGIGPDIALNQARISPVNYASRGALLPLDEFDTFKEVESRFSEGALIPYQMNGETYGIPTKQTFQMMYYRKDIFEELNLKVPETWDEFINVTIALQQKNMEIRLPYSEITAPGIQDGGIGIKDIFSTIFLQNGGKFYDDDMTTSLLGSPEGFKAFDTWTKFYTEIGIPLTSSFETRFRSGEMPLGIDSVELYNNLTAVGTEIRGLWAIAPVPGTRQEDGTINRLAGESGNANFIMKTAGDKKENCWKFIDWYTSAETQYQFGIQVENLLGTAARFTTANQEAYARLPWTKDELAALKIQIDNLVEIPEIPGAYFMPRSIDNAFRDVQNKNRNARESWNREIASVNRELDRKNKELKTGKYAENN